jgi:hypothetical protein
MEKTKLGWELKKISNIIKMPQTGGKDKSSLKRHFTVVIGTKEHGLYCSSSPSSAARKAVSKLCGKEKGKRVEFFLREITQLSKKKNYGPYLGYIEKLSKPIQLKGRLVERMPVALLKAKTSAKKSEMRGGEIEDITISLGNCGRSSKLGFWKNGCITLSCNDKKVVLYYNKKTEQIEIRYFNDKNNNVYNEYPEIYDLDNFSIKDFDNIISYLLKNVKTDKQINGKEFKERCITLLSNHTSNDIKKNIILDGDNVKLIKKIIESINNSNLINTSRPVKEKLNLILIKESEDKLRKAIELCSRFKNLSDRI